MYLLAAAALALSACSPDTPAAPGSNKKLTIGPAAFNTSAADSLPPARTALAYLLADQPDRSGYAPFNHDLHHFAQVDIALGQVHRYIARFGGPVISESTRAVDMVTTFGSATVQCSSPGPTRSLNEERSIVTCLDVINGTMVQSKFGVLVVAVGAGLSTPFAFATADQPTAASYAPDTSRSFTTGTQPILIERIGVGDWYVHLGTGNSQGSMFLVSSTDANSVCVVGEWTNFGARVKCFNRTGVVADVPFKVLQMAHGRPNGYFGFAWADQRSLMASYTPSRSFYVNHGVPGTVHVVRNGVGTYTVDFTSPHVADIRGESVQVTPFGLAFAACAVVSETQAPAGVGTSHIAVVECRNEHGALIDSRFNITILN